MIAKPDVLCDRKFFLINFKQQFAEMVESGEKRQTIRRERKGHRQIGKGDHLKLYTGLRTKQCRLLGEGIVNYVMSICIGPKGASFFTGQRSIAAPESLYQDDGFESYQDMYKWFLGQYKTDVFCGRLIIWDLYDPSAT